MELTKNYDGLKLTVNVIGQIDTNTAPNLEKMVNAELSRATDVTLDFSKVEYISSAGLRVLLSLYKTQNDRKHEFVLVNVSSEVMTILDMTGFTSFLTIK